MESAPARDALRDLRSFLDGAPSAWHVVASAVERLEAAGFAATGPTDLVGAQGYMRRDGALVAWRAAPATPPGTAFRVVGAHTDSPGLRVKPLPDTGALGWQQLGIEVYGGALLNSWLDRDLGLAGRVMLRGSTALDFVADEALCRVPQLAIHLDRDVNERGLVLDKQQHLTPVWGTGAVTDGLFVEWLAGHLGVERGEVLTWDVSLFDRTPSAVLGHDASLLAAGRLDNQLSCWAALHALLAADPQHSIAVIALFDHEEVGSASTTGAAGPLLEHALERIALASGADRAQFIAALGASRCVSADNAHAVHPNYVERHEPDHRPLVNHGPAIKLNANQRYASSAPTAAWMAETLAAAGVPWQVFVSRNNMPCGSTIGPITATRLGIDTVDVGIPQLSMHSARELCGVHDPPWLAAALTTFLQGASGRD